MSREKMGPMRIIRRVTRSVVSRLYRHHVGYEFPRSMLENAPPEALEAPAGYEVRQPPLQSDFEAVAGLLNQEPGFGKWTASRVQAELMERLAHPMAATLVLHQGIPVALAFATDASTRSRRVAHGMYLYVAPAHRRRSHLGTFVVYNTLGRCLDAGYQCVMGFTDPDRLSALLLYLSNGARPVHDSLSSYWNWRKIHRRLAPALRRMERQRALRESGKLAGSQSSP